MRSAQCSVLCAPSAPSGRNLVFYWLLLKFCLGVRGPFTLLFRAQPPLVAPQQNRQSFDALRQNIDASVKTLTRLAKTLTPVVKTLTLFPQPETGIRSSDLPQKPDLAVPKKPERFRAVSHFSQKPDMGVPISRTGQKPNPLKSLLFSNGTPIAL